MDTSTRCVSAFTYMLSNVSVLSGCKNSVLFNVKNCGAGATLGLKVPWLDSRNDDVPVECSRVEIGLYGGATVAVQVVPRPFSAPSARSPGASAVVRHW